MVPEHDDAKEDGAEGLELSADAEPSKVGCKMAPEDSRYFARG